MTAIVQPPMTNLLRLVPVAFLLGGSLLAGCRATTVDLAGRAFLSVAVSENGAPRALVAGTRVRLEFTADTITAVTGCNSIGGMYTIEGGRLTLGSTFTTEMACDPARMAQDTWLMGVLGAKPTFVLVGDQLTIDSGPVTLVLRDRRVVEPDLALAGPTWTLDSIFTGDAVQSAPQGVVATLVFHADGTLDVDDGCNTGSARWKAVGSGIEVTDLGLTKKACPGPAAAVEAAIVGVLRAGSIAAAIEANQLILRAGTGGLGFRAAS